MLFEALSNSNIEVLLVGNGDRLPALLDLAAKLNVNAEFVGEIPNSKMPDMYNDAAVCVLCSSYEGNPKVLLEAMSCSCAVIGTNVPGIRELIRHQANGLLVELTSDSLREAIDHLLLDPILRDRLGRQAREDILESNSLSEYAQKEADVYRQLC